MLFTNMFDKVGDSLKHYDYTRTKNGRALTIPSAVRQVYHFKHFLDRVCRGPNDDKNYVMYSLKNYSAVM